MYHALDIQYGARVNTNTRIQTRARIPNRTQTGTRTHLAVVPRIPKPWITNTVL